MAISILINIEVRNKIPVIETMEDAKVILDYTDPRVIRVDAIANIRPTLYGNTFFEFVLISREGLPKSPVHDTQKSSSKYSL